MKIYMSPSPTQYDNWESGIKRVVEAYARYLPKYGVTFTENPDDCDIRAVHAGTSGKDVDVAHLHGLYWTGDFVTAPPWADTANKNIIEALRYAKEVTVPSEWVADSVARNMRFRPHVVPHGIEWEDWQDKAENQGYILWNKNRRADVCDPQPVAELAKRFNSKNFVTTFMPEDHKVMQNVMITGVVPHKTMKNMILGASVYMSTPQETFGIGVLEALSAGIPVLGFDYGGNADLVVHGETGYLAEPGNIEDLAAGLAFCTEHRDILSKNARESAKKWKWDKVIEQVYNIYTMANKVEEPDVSVIIPSYNAEGTLEETVRSAVDQRLMPKEVIIVDDGSTDKTKEIGKKLEKEFDIVTYIHQENASVAEARNTGIRHAKTKYVTCLDSDDKISDAFLAVCVNYLEDNKDIGIAYTSLGYMLNGKLEVSNWPPDEPNYEMQIKPRGADNLRGRMNQIPTCCVFPKEMWRRLGGYNRKYCPLGAGAEDAEFWTRAGSIGYKAAKASKSPMFIYHTGGSVSTGVRGGGTSKDLLETFWLENKPWAIDGIHPFGSVAKPKNGLAHKVYQYDEPVISVVIPIGPKHISIARNAIESVEGQSLRNWELIIVMDMEKCDNNIHEIAPYAKIIYTGGGKGAGYARNRGAEVARGSFLLFLDGDDEIKPKFMESTLDTWMDIDENAIIYTDYYNRFITTAEDLNEHQSPQRIESFYKETGFATVRGNSADYDCARAQSQPNYDAKDLYHWTIVTCLIPREWHNEIGGFDEEMETFEDMLYHWTMAKAGKCYVRLKDNLVLYNMESGTRRKLADINTSEGLLTAKRMLQYSRNQLERMETMTCGGCPGSKQPITNATIMARTAPITELADDDTVMIRYLHPNTGTHPVVGAVSGRKYNYHKKHDKFLVLKSDQQAQPQLYQVAEAKQPPRVEKKTELKQPVTYKVDPEDLSLLPGMTPSIIAVLKADGILTYDAIREIGVDNIQRYPGIAEKKAEAIFNALESLMP